MLRHRAFITAALSASLLFTVALPAQASDDHLVQKKSFSSGSASGTVKRYEDRSGSREKNWVTVTNRDKPGGKCTEVWWDYSTKPWQHFNPGVVVNCTGKTVTMSKLHMTSYHGIAGVGVIVCEVPNTSGPIIRNSKNCRGNLGAMYTYSGKPYKRFAVKATQRPNGIYVHWA